MNAPNEEIKISCPHCGQHLVIDGTMLGLELECPMCKQPFSARRPETTSDPEPQFESDPPTDESESDQRNGPERFQGERESPPLPETHQTSWMKSKIAFSSAYVWTKRVFLRLPQRVQGAVLTAVVFLAGIAVFSWMGEPWPSNTSSQQPPRPDIKPLTDDKGGSVRDPINGVSGSQLHAKALCDEFVNGGSTVMVDGTKVVFWHSFGKPFTRINETTVRWDNGGENPPFLCEVVFSNDGTARLTQDNTFFAREFRRNSLNEISDALRRAFNSLTADDSGIRNATANVTADSHVLLSAEVSVSSGNVRESIGKAFFKMNCSRTLLRM